MQKEIKKPEKCQVIHSSGLRWRSLYQAIKNYLLGQLRQGFFQVYLDAAVNGNTFPILLAYDQGVNIEFRNTGEIRHQLRDAQQAITQLVHLRRRGTASAF